MDGVDGAGVVRAESVARGIDGERCGGRGESGEPRAVSLADEQAYVTMLYGLLDAARARSEEALKDVNARGAPGGTHQARLERDVAAGEQQARLAQLNGIEHGLCFGRTRSDEQGPGTLYVGRIGLRDNEYDLRLIDWRAPAARPFYAATPGSPSGADPPPAHLHQRPHRHRASTTRSSTSTGCPSRTGPGLSGEATLIAASPAARTGRMTDVVATIQAEQDRVIRSALQGVLVVQGGPGTGKTVAALHRAAYLLYTHRRTLERRGVLVIGPNPTFLRYISQVLPSLGGDRRGAPHAGRACTRA